MLGDGLLITSTPKKHHEDWKLEGKNIVEKCERCTGRERNGQQRTTKDQLEAHGRDRKDQSRLEKLD